MMRLLELLVFLVMVSVPLFLFASLALVLLLALIKRRSWRLGVAVFGGYLVLIGTVTYCAYAVVPAQYTRYHQWTRLPVSSSLGEQHGEALARAETIAPQSPADAWLLRERIRHERDIFIGEWSRIGAYGLIGPIVLLLWGRHNGWYLLRRRLFGRS